MGTSVAACAPPTPRPQTSELGRGHLTLRRRHVATVTSLRVLVVGRMIGRVRGHLGDALVDQPLRHTARALAQDCHLFGARPHPHPIIEHELSRCVAATEEDGRIGVES